MEDTPGPSEPATRRSKRPRVPTGKADEDWSPNQDSFDDFDRSPNQTQPKLKPAPPAPKENLTLIEREGEGEREKGQSTGGMANDSALNLGGIWDQIELSESYLVSGMYEEAASLATSILKEDLSSNERLTIEEKESAGMVLVQALKELGRAQVTLNELLQLFDLITIPIQVFLAGVCFQLSAGICQDTQRLVEEFLSKWIFVNDNQLYNYYIPASAESNLMVGVEEYLEVVEIYVVSLVGDLDSAVSWVEKASLPDDKRQDLLRRVQSLYSRKAVGQSQDSVSSPTNGSQSHYLIREQQQTPQEGLEEPFKAHSGGENNTKQSILKLSQQRVGCIWWFRNITLKLGNSRLAISNGKLVMGCLMVLIYYMLLRKRISLKENIKRRALSVRKSLVELWELAFSYHVNPLAAIQPIPTATRGN